MMEIGQYETRRLELVHAIDEALALPHVATRASETLAMIRKKIFENQFRIVLISGFESGKSTTFNALCDGQEVSPRGAMLRTSATVISAQHTTDKNLVGKAEVVWRSDKELTLIFAKYILQALKHLDKERFEGVNQSEQLATLLQYPKDISLIRQAIRLRQKEFTIDTPVEEKETLRMAMLICEYYEAPLIRQVKAMQYFSVQDVEKMVRFPSQWHRKGRGEIAFADHECLFLFVKETHLYIQSQQLMRTGSVLIDCPGLFASTYDTRVAFDILENADAVWYILNGIGMGQEDIDCAKRLVTAKPNQIFYTVNMLSNTKSNIEKNIIPSYVDTFEQLNITLQASDFLPYHALLALVAIQADKVMNGSLDEHSKRAIYQLAERFGTSYETLEDILSAWAENALCNVYGYTLRQLKTFDLFAPDHSGIKFISELCGLETILSTIENSVVRQKAYSILVENGSKKVIELLTQLEADLKVEEKVARETEEKMEDEFDAAQECLDAFQSFCESELEELRDRTMDHSLALDYWQDVIVSSMDDVARKSAERIVALNCNEIRQDENEQIINDTFSEVVLPKATAWADTIRSGQNENFNALIANRISKIIKRTNERWQLTIQDQPMLAGLPVPTPIIGTDIVASEFIDAIVAKTPGVSGEVVTGAATCMAIGVLLGSFVFPGLGTVLGGAIGGVIGVLLGGGIGTEKREKYIYTALKEKLCETVVFSEQESADHSVIQKQEKRIKALRLGILKAFEDAFEGTKNAFEERQARALQMFRIQTRQREQLAEMHRSIRKEKIEPLRKKLQTYEALVQSECSICKDEH